MATKIRLGILGSGYMGRTHAEATVHVEGLELTAVACGTRSRKLAADYGAACEDTAEALVSRPDVDAVVITTPHFAHFAEAKLALEAGKHLLVEKPLTTSVAECEELVEMAAQRKLTLATAYHQRFRVNNIAARKLIQAGEIGDVLTIQVSMPFDIGELQEGGFGGNWDWWADPRSVGHIINSAPHVVDLLRWMMRSEITAVSAFSRTFRKNSAVEDTTVAILLFDNGSLVSLYSSCALPVPPFPGEDARFRIVGSKALLDLDLYGELRLETAGGWQVVSTQPQVGHSDSTAAFSRPRIQAYTDQLAAFLHAIRGHKLEAGQR